MVLSSPILLFLIIFLLYKHYTHGSKGKDRQGAGAQFIKKRHNFLERLLRWQDAINKNEDNVKIYTEN